MNLKSQARRYFGSILLTLPAIAGACAPSSGGAMREAARSVERQEDPDKLVLRGEAWASVGEPGRAAQYFELAVVHGASEERIFPHLLVMLIRDKQYQAATIAAENHLRLRPADLRARLVVAGLYASLGNFVSARKEYETILRRDPDNVDAHYSLAVILREEQNEPLLGDQHFREYLRLLPDGPHAEQARGLLLESVR